MGRWLRATLAALLLWVSCAVAAEYAIDATTIQQCQGMYGKNAWGGNTDPQIIVKFTKSDDPDQIVSFVIFEYGDEELLGRWTKDDPPLRDFICTEEASKVGECPESDIGAFILAENANSTAKNVLYTAAIKLSEEKPINYPIKRTGYYCVWTNPFFPAELEYSAIVTFQNSYGELPASQIAKLPFYGGLTIVYALIGALWAFLYVQHRRDILPVQNYITAIIIFLIIEMLITWAFYDYQNRHGSNALSHILMIVVAILNAARNSFSFFLLLIVCLGYGVVKHTLGATMKWVRILAITHFVFGVIYAIASLTITPDSAGPIVLFVILPLAATLTAFYVWTLNALKLTMAELAERKQHIKGLMYRRLWWTLLASIFVIFAFFFLNSLTFAGHGSPDFAPRNWKTRWFVLDGWLNLVYLADMAVISYLWRPTANNRRFAMSDEIAQDEDGGFEIESIGGSELDESDDEDDAERGRAGREKETGPSSSSSTQGMGTGSGTGRRSMEEPIFEVGEEDGGWSDGEAEESSEDEGKGLKASKKD